MLANVLLGKTQCVMVPAVLSGNVLVFPQEGSHWVNMRVLVEELHSRGHDVTVIRAADSWYISQTSPHYQTVTLDVAFGANESFFPPFCGVLENTHSSSCLWGQFEQTVKGFEMLEKASESIKWLLDNKEIMQSIKDTNFDLILSDPVAPFGAIMANYLKLPLVFNVRWTSHGEGHFEIAPSPLSYIPLMGTQFSDRMSFFQRLQNVLTFGFMKAQLAWVTIPSYDDLIKKYLGPDIEYTSLFQAADLWLMRVDFVFEFPRPTMPNVVYMGGFQCKPAKPLPEHLEEFAQSSGEHGLIIMSLGTFIAELPPDLADEIAAAFAKLPQKVIWRYKGAKPATLGNNTLLVDWMPQNDLLGHPKTKLFVAHGGTNGVQEAIYHGVPVIGLPLIFDQPDNVRRLEVRGAGKVLDFFTLTEEIFSQGIQEVLHDPSYRTNMQRLSRLHRDQPMKPMDTALFWIEFVMRHKGAAHLRTESYKLPWYSYHSVDVVLFLTATVLLIILTIITVFKYLFTKVCKRKVKHD
uniref:UDP-glucuronosyltransferase n=1 Tax=Tetraodon nigroviridis TaxID=99883 RepID=H3D333_TETNG